MLSVIAECERAAARHESANGEAARVYGHAHLLTAKSFGRVRHRHERVGAQEPFCVVTEPKPAEGVVLEVLVHLRVWCDAETCRRV